MGATVAAVSEWVGTMFASGAAAEGAGAAAAGGAAAEGGAAAMAGVAGGTVGTGAGVAAGAGAGAAASGGLGGMFASSLGQALGGTLAGQMLAPKQAAPGVKEPMAQPDPLAQQKAREQSIAEQLARRGRASTILTNESGSGKLGG